LHEYNENLPLRTASRALGLSRTQLWRIETMRAPLSLEVLQHCTRLLRQPASLLVPFLRALPANDYECEKEGHGD
jgi:transcriptional regulator with XRE-family HTH domain